MKAILIDKIASQKIILSDSLKQDEDEDYVLPITNEEIYSGSALIFGVANDHAEPGQRVPVWVPIK